MTKFEMNDILINKKNNQVEIVFDLIYLKNAWVKTTDNPKRNIYLKYIPETLVIRDQEFLSTSEGILIENLGEFPESMNLKTRSLFNPLIPVCFLPWSIIKRIDKISIQKLKLNFE